ncbi:Gfo/Idh/MocA family protein [Alkalitalea saponilacus]|uniref:Predicted dehydrogenase n=1 Tax=Alkalitalea saponilacus TaxID=889453 RepID=A0A1T5HNA0_9BACT|nr:Gfo/Idh/MocA family oxidoreductase [Alkalitalea saponilacus]ASB49358.1 oxidoreductase [Alkalitalea saponilacus]SKC22107.1 Predicted dehydrogenase [Alkalitalea saponilacus]
MTQTRRSFCKNSAAVIAGASLASALPGMTGCSSKGPKIRYGVIGVNGMGLTNIMRFMEQPDTELVAMCDVDQNILTRRVHDARDYYLKTREKTGQGEVQPPEIAEYNDYRDLIARDDIDAVIIATPDHWHCLPFIDACKAGKDIYVEKPLANTIGECLIMEKYAKQYNRVVQVGQWQRSGDHWQDAMAYVHSGKLGNIRKVKTWAYLSWLKPVPRPDGNPPAGVDYDFWLGPAPKRPFNGNRFHFHFRWFWDYGGGLMTDWGAHLIDFALYGMKASMPNSIMSVGGNFSIDKAAMETPDTQTAIYEFDDFILQWEHAIGIDRGPYNRGHGVAFIGDNGTLVVDRGGWEVLPEKPGQEGSIAEVPRQTGDGKDAANHVRDFLDCMRTRKTPRGSIDVGKEIAIVSHMGNIAHRVGEKLYWDDNKKEFVNNNKANDLIWPVYRKPWELPKV